MNLFQTISSTCLQCEHIKNYLIEVKLNKQLKELIKSTKVEDNLLEYQIKGQLFII